MNAHNHDTTVVGVNVTDLIPNDMEGHLDTNSTNTINIESPNIELEQLIPFYKLDKENLKFAHININSVRHKYGPLCELLLNGILDVLSIQETKLDASFPDQQFKCDGFRCYRKDYTSNAGGIMLYVRNDLAQRRRRDLEFDCDDRNGRLECVCVEIYIRSEKWLYVTV